jgi:hypothetical protein
VRFYLTFYHAGRNLQDKPDEAGTSSERKRLARTDATESLNFLQNLFPADKKISEYCFPNNFIAYLCGIIQTIFVAKKCRSLIARFFLTVYLQGKAIFCFKKD